MLWEGQTRPADEQGGPRSGQPTGRLTLSFTSRHCCRQQEPARLHPESLLLPATRLGSRYPAWARRP